MKSKIERTLIEEKKCVICGAEVPVQWFLCCDCLRKEINRLQRQLYDFKAQYKKRKYFLKELGEYGEGENYGQKEM